ncbi:MAG: MBL fold metallo-hydrolase [Calditrichaceae bacterium]
MIVKQFRVGGDRNFGYLVVDESTGKAAVIDPSYNPNMILDFADENKYQIIYVFNTHGHWDHSNGNKEAEKRTGVNAVGYGDKEKSSGKRIKNNTVLP